MDNYIVSARKYRPATFESVVGQSHITSTLRNAISRNQLAHAYLFCGPRGVGKTTCARIFAKAINCTSPSGSEACGECESCLSFSQGRSFNIHELDAASNNSVDDIRSLTEQVRIPPQVGKYSVYIIDEVHMLSQAAFNAFLKTLEEPPAHAIFILATTEKHKIIPTILSRCQIYDFNRIRVEDSVGYLRHIAASEGITFDDESLNLIAQKADGGMRDALSMFDKAVAFCGTALDFRQVARTLNVLDYDTYFTITDVIAGGNYKEALLIFDEVLRKGFSGQTFLAGLGSHFRDLLMSKDPSTLSLLEVTGSLLERYQQQAQRIDTGFLFAAIAHLGALDNTFKSATNQRLHVELGLMKLCGLGQKKNELEQSSPSLPPLTKENSPSAGGQSTTASVGSTSDGNGRSDRPASAGGDPQNSATRESQSSSSQESHSSATDESLATSAQPKSSDSPDSPNPQASTNGHPHSLDSGVNATTAESATDPRPAPETAFDTGAVSASSDDIEAAQGANSSDTHSNNISHNGPPEPAVDATHQKNATGKAEADSSARTAGVADQGKTRGAEDISPGPLSGFSINNILKNGRASARRGGEPSKGEESPESVDPQCTEKIVAAKEKFIESLNRQRPRFASAFSSMTVQENTISISVSTDLLKDDIVQHQKEILDQLRKVSGVVGPVNFQITVREDKTAIRPIKPEDKLTHLRAKNSLLDELRRELELEIE